ncbi:hypothetical protein WME91_07620 [Sorangium sp. So ce269]
MDYLIPDDGAGGYRDYDEVSYAFTLRSAFTDGAGKAFVWLVYQPTTKHYVEILEHANAGKNDRGAKLRATWEATGKAAPFVVAELTTDVTLVGGTLPDPGAGGRAAHPKAGGGGAAPAGGASGAGPANPAGPATSPEGGGCSCNPVRGQQAVWSSPASVDTPDGTRRQE